FPPVIAKRFRDQMGGFQLPFCNEGFEGIGRNGADLPSADIPVEPAEEIMLFGHALSRRETKNQRRSARLTSPGNPTLDKPILTGQARVRNMPLPACPFASSTAGRPAREEAFARAARGKKCPQAGWAKCRYPFGDAEAESSPFPTKAPVTRGPLFCAS